MHRRHFLGSVAAASLSRPAAAQVEVEVVHPRNPYEDLLREVDPRDKEASEIAVRLRDLRALPLASNFPGASPFPARYRQIAPDVRVAEFDVAANFADGLTRWLDTAGTTRFFVLPDNRVRFEAKSDREYRVGHWEMRWTEGKLSYFRPIEEIVTTAPEPLFRDVTTHAFRGVESFDRQLAYGVPWWRARLDAACGIDVHGHNGIAVGDIDDDGWDEIYVCQPGGLPNRLYKNRGDGTLEDITDHAGVGVLDATSSALFADFRNSGRQDLVVLRPEGPLFFLNQGGNRFAVQQGAFRFRNTPQGSFTGMAAADYDRDGRLDLYLCTYSFFRDAGQYRYPTPYFDAQNGPANFLFHNEGDRFLDVTTAVGMDQNNNRFSFAPAWSGSDLYVANDFGRNNFYRYEGGKFRDVAAEAGVEDIGDGMSASWFDYDGDGRPDLYVSDMWSAAGQRIVTPEWRRHAKGNSLFRNRGDGTFEDTGAAEGVEMGRWAWSSGGFDFDNDGVPEIFSTAGMLTNESETDLETFFWRKVVSATGEAYENGWNTLSQAVHAEYSEAGRQPNVFYKRRNGRYYDFSGVSGLDVAEDSRTFAVTDIDGDGNLDLILKNRLGPQVRVYQNNSTAGRKSIAIRLRGVKSNRDGIGARVSVDGQVKWVDAGSGYLSQHTKVLHFAGSGSVVQIDWPSGEHQEFRNLEAGFRYEIEEGSSEIRRKPFLATRPLPSAVVHGDNIPRHSDTWLLSPVPLPEKAAPGYMQVTKHSDWYAILVRYLFDWRADLKLPVWFLVDDQNRARRICFSPPNPNDRPAPLPFAGRYYSQPVRNYAALGAAFFGAGHPEQALLYLREAPQTDAQVLSAIGRIHLQARRWPEARDYLEHSLRLAPDSAEGWNSLGAVEVNTGNMSAALRDFGRAIALKPTLSSALVNAGQAHMALRNPAEGERLLQRALEVNPRDAAAANILGEVARDDAAARRWFQQAIAARRDYAPAINNLARLYARSGQTNDAIAAYRYGIDVAPDEESFYLNLASLYASTDNRDAAHQTIERLLTRKPGSEAGQQALRELERR